MSRLRCERLHSLELGTLALFALLLIAAYPASDDFLERWPQALSNAVLFLIALVGVLVGRPFVRDYAVASVDQATARSDGFRVITTAMTWMWVGAFGIMLVSSLIPSIVDGEATILDEDDALSVVCHWVIPFAALGVAGAISAAFPKWLESRSAQVDRRAAGEPVAAHAPAPRTPPKAAWRCPPAATTSTAGSGARRRPSRCRRTGSWTPATAPSSRRCASARPTPSPSSSCRPPSPGRDREATAGDGAGGGPATARRTTRGDAALAQAWIAGSEAAEGIAEVPLERFGGALEHLAGQAGVDPSRVAAMAIPRGAEGLLAAAAGGLAPPLRGLVLVSPSFVTWQAIGRRGPARRDGARAGVPRAPHRAGLRGTS